VTNAHVVAGAARVEIFDDSGALLGIAPYAEMLSSTVDLAILPSVGVRVPALPLALTAPAVGEQVIVIGAPEGLTNTVSDGIVSAVRQLETRRLLQITAPISPGSSGGPVLNARGEVVGVSVSILREGQNLNFAVPAADVIALTASRAGHFEFPAPQGEDEKASNDHDRSGPTKAAIDFPLLPLGRDVSGVIAATDMLSNGKYVSYYHFYGVKGAHVSVRVRSDDFDPFVAIYRVVGDSVVVVAADDDSGGGLNAKAFLTFPANEMYFVGIFATPSSRSKLGNFVVSLELSDGSSQGSGATDSDDQSRWLEVGHIDNHNAHMEFDRATATSSGYQTYLVWERTTFSTPYTDSHGDTSDVVKIQYEISCSEHRMRMRSGAKYFHGTLILSATNVDPWEAAIPESIGESLLNTVCAYAKSHGI